MQINIKGTKLTFTPSLRTYIERKLGTLTKFLKQLETESGVEMKVEIARTTRHHRHGEVFMAEVNLPLPGRTLRAAEYSADARTAVDAVREKLQLEIEKYKAKTTGRPRRQKSVKELI